MFADMCSLPTSLPCIVHAEVCKSPCVGLVSTVGIFSAVLQTNAVLLLQSYQVKEQLSFRYTLSMDVDVLLADTFLSNQKLETKGFDRTSGSRR